MEPMISTDVHPALAPVTFLLGTWRGEGEGQYPSIKPFRYREEIRFTHNGKPFLIYAQRTEAIDTGQPMHAEAGYLRLVGEGRLEFVIAQPIVLDGRRDAALRGEDGVGRGRRDSPPHGHLPPHGLAPARPPPRLDAPVIRAVRLRRTFSLRRVLARATSSREGPAGRPSGRRRRMRGYRRS